MAARQRKYSDDERAAAMAELSAAGGNVAHVSRSMGIPQNTIRNWRDGKGVIPPEVVAEKKEQLAALFESEARGALEAAKDKRGDASYRDLVTAAAISADKHQLLTGKATSRVETREADDMTPDEAIDIVRRERELRVVEGGKGKRSA